MLIFYNILLIDKIKGLLTEKLGKCTLDEMIENFSCITHFSFKFAMQNSIFTMFKAFSFK